MADFSDLKKTARDWKVTTYAEAGAFAGLGGKVSYLKFYSPSLKKGLNTLLLEVGTGGEVKVDFSFIKTLNSLLTNANKAKETATADANYKSVLCKRAFSRFDIMGAKTVAMEASVSSITGIKCSALSAYSDGMLLFDISAEVSNTLGIGGGASGTTGIFFAFGKEVSDPYMRERFNMEMKRKSATEQVPRPPGGFSM